MNEERLLEVRRRKYLNEMLDFCLYGNCLQEETAREYFDWLLPRVLKRVPEDWYGESDVDENGNSKVYMDKFDDYEEMNYESKKKLLLDLGNDRFEVCREESDSDEGVVDEYFTGGEKKFRNQLDDLYAELQKQARKRKMDLTDLKKIRDCYTFYCKLFVKELVPGDSFTVSPYLSSKSKWSDKRSSKKMFDKKHRLNPLKNGESWKTSSDSEFENPREELRRYRSAS